MYGGRPRRPGPPPGYRGSPRRGPSYDGRPRSRPRSGPPYPPSRSPGYGPRPPYPTQPVNNRGRQCAYALIIFTILAGIALAIGLPLGILNAGSDDLNEYTLSMDFPLNCTADIDTPGSDAFIAAEAQLCNYQRQIHDSDLSSCNVQSISGCPTNGKRRKRSTTAIAIFKIKLKSVRAATVADLKAVIDSRTAARVSRGGLTFFSSPVTASLIPTTVILAITSSDGVDVTVTTTTTTTTTAAATTTTGSTVTTTAGTPVTTTAGTPVNTTTGTPMNTTTGAQATSAASG